MADNQSQDAVTLTDAIADALEAARVEVVRRLAVRQIPLTIQVPELRIVPTAEGGWRSEWATVSMSPLRNLNVELAVRDDSIPHRLLGLRPQLEPLAELLNDTTDLGSRVANLLPALTGVDAILARYLNGVAREYLWSLESLDRSHRADGRRGRAR